jgi:hypothetical protein
MSFTNDVLSFIASDLDLQALYRTIPSNDTLVARHVNLAESLLREQSLLLPKIDRRMLFVMKVGIHPYIAKLLFTFADEVGLDKLFPMLLLIATIQRIERRVCETRDHGEREIDNDLTKTSNLGKALLLNSSLIDRRGGLGSSEDEQTGEGRFLKVLIRLVEQTRQLYETHIPVLSCTASLNPFIKRVGEMLERLFPEDILEKVPGTMTAVAYYKNRKHPQLLWRATDNPPFLRVFPLSSVLEKNGNRLHLFAPLA